jgi:STE24 endopeptidase
VRNRAKLWAIAMGALAVAMVLTMPMLGGGAQAATSATNAPEVDIAVGPGTLTVVYIELPSSAPSADAYPVVDAVAHALGSGARPRSSVVKNGVRRFRLNVDVATHAAFASSRIPASTVQKIAHAANEPVVIELQNGFRIVDGNVTHISGTPGTRYRIGSGADVVYGMGAAPIRDDAAFLVAMLVLGFAILRPWARRVERRSGDVADRVHSLQRVAMFGGFAVVVVMLVTIATGWVFVPSVLIAGIAPATAGWRGLAAIGLIIGIIVPLVVWCISATVAIQPSLRRLRGIGQKPKRTTQGRYVAMAAGPAALWAVALGVGGTSGSVGRLIALAVYLGFVLLVWPSILVHILPTRPASDELQAHFEALCRREHTKIRGIRILKAKRNKVANAMLLGVGRFRYVLITDYLLDNTDPEALDGVVLHEIGHAKQHHLLKKLGAFVGAMFVLFGVFGGIVALTHPSPAIAAIGVAALVLMSVIVVNGVVGIRLETKADDFAASVVGPDAMRRGLDTLAQLNTAKRRTGPVWNLVTQHPGIAQRVERLEAEGAHEPRPLATVEH